jgi:HSP20 family protein
MATENEPGSATPQASKEQETSPSKTGMVRRSQEGGIATSRRMSGFPLAPHEMLRMSPFALFRRMTEEFDRVLQPFMPGGDASANRVWTPPIEVFERDGKYHVVTELPGLSPNDVRIEVENDELVIQGERQVERDRNEGGVHLSERQVGYFYRRIPLPEGADPGGAKATFRDGVLEIIMPAPKQETEKRQIQIESDSKASSGETKQAAA